VIEPLPVELGDLRQSAQPPGFVEVPVQRVIGSDIQPDSDELAVEEPLEIRLGYTLDGQRVQRAISITMRTPGQDVELAAGFLFSEGIIRGQDDLLSVRSCGSTVAPLRLHNVVRVELRPNVRIDLGRLERHFYTTSSCGVCGKASLDALQLTPPHEILIAEPVLATETIHRLPQQLRSAQSVFDHTGGLHGAGLFSAAGELLSLREDVGRHNAVDKLIGAELFAGRLPLQHDILLVSGRASFELMQKALMASIPVMVAVGAPSSLAVELARRYRITLIGFARDGRFNVYSGAWRLTAHPASRGMT
jgi:FdhD protein